MDTKAIEKDASTMSTRRGSISDLLKSRSRGRLTRVLTAVAALFLLGLPLYHLDGFDNKSAYLPEPESNTIVASTSWTLSDNSTCEDVRRYGESLPVVEWLHVAQLSAEEELFPWTDDWIAKGTLPEHLQLEHPKFDLVYTWANDSDPDFKHEKLPYDKIYANVSDEIFPAWKAEHDSRHRSFDELRYSVRSAVRFGASWLSKVVVVSKCLRKRDGSGSVVQQPDWLSTDFDEAEVPVQVVNERALMKYTQCLPTYNSVSVESQLSHLPNGTRHIVASSDDMFFGSSISASDFYSELYGMSFNNYRGIYTFNEVEEPVLDPKIGGETLVAKYTSYLLNKRFGRRRRPLQQHFQKVISKEIMNQAMRTFPQASVLSPLSRHRYDAQQTYSWYLHNQFTVEMHREAMLWSILTKMDADADGFLDGEEQDVLLSEVEAGKAAQLRSNDYGKQSSALSKMEKNLQSAGLPTPLVQSVSWTSMDGPLYMRDIDAEFCAQVYKHDQCLGLDGLSGEQKKTRSLLDILTILNKQSVECGDCLIRYMLDNAEKGLDVILPRADNPNAAVYRQSALRALKMYAYQSSTPNGAFHMVQNLRDADALVNTTIAGFTCINDDLVTQDPEVVYKAFKGYAALFQRLFPTKLKLEKYPPIDLQSASEN